MVDRSEVGIHLSRREVLALTLSGTAVGLAGCSGGSNNTTTGGGNSTGGTSTNRAATATAATGTSSSSTATSRTTGRGTKASSVGGTNTGNGGTSQNDTQFSPDQMADSVVNVNTGLLPQNANWNHRSNGPLLSFFPFEYTVHKFGNGNTAWTLLEKDGYSYDSDSKTVTYNFREDFSYWWNGDPVTAKDYFIQNEIDRLTDPAGSPWKSWTIDGEYTLKGKRKKKINPILLNTGGDRVFEYRGIWQQWLEKLQDATTDSERKSILEKLTKWEISTKEFANKGLGNGPYRPQDWSTTKMTWKRFDQHPHANQIPIPTVEWNIGSGSSANQMVSQDKLDIGTGTFPQELRQASPDYLKTIPNSKIRSIQLRNLLFNYNRKHIGRRNVRRALVSILDFTRLVDFWNGKGGFVKQKQTGLPEVLENKWLNEKIVNNMYNYPLKSDPKKAKMFMQRAGYSKKSGTWTGPDGDPLKFNLIIAEPVGTSPALGRALVQTWNQWGTKADLVPVSTAQRHEKVFNPSGDWDIALFQHGFYLLDPLNYFDTVNPYHMALGPSYSQIEQWLKEGKTHSPFNGHPLKLKIPSSPGLKVGNDGGQQINIYKLVEELKTTQSKDRSQKIINRLATYFNYDLPMFDMFPHINAVWGDTKDFNWPNKSDYWYQHGSLAMYDTILKGLIKPVSKNS